MLAQIAASEGMTKAVRAQQQQYALRIEELVWDRDELLSRLREFQARVSLPSSSLSCMLLLLVILLMSFALA